MTDKKEKNVEEELPYNNQNKIISEEEIYKFLKEGDITHKITNVNLFRLAFVHKSYCTRKNENIINGNINCPTDCLPLQEESYERLEYLGDSVLNTSTAYYLFERYPNENEGFLTQMRTKLVNGKMLSKLSIEIGLNKYLIISKQLERSDARNYKDYTEDVFEAFIGAIRKDMGYEIAQEWIINIFENYVDFTELVKQNQNYKDLLIKYCQQNLHYKPEFIDTNQLNNINKEKEKEKVKEHQLYINIEDVKKEHKEYNELNIQNSISPKSYNLNNTSDNDIPSPKEYTIYIKTKEGTIIGIGKGANKKQAEQEASMKALKYYNLLY
jgi:dsRNA-specific ribonuclease